jgi:hypothetical protein
MDEESMTERTKRAPLTKAALKRRITALLADRKVLIRDLHEARKQTAELNRTLGHYEQIMHGDRFREHAQSLDIVARQRDNHFRSFCAMSRDIKMIREELARKADK